MAIAKKKIFLDKELAKNIDSRYGTPCHIYSERIIRSRARRLNKSLNGLGFRNFFAVKATPNPSVLRILHAEGMGMDCSSIAELELCRRSGITGRDIMFTSNNTADEEFVLACQLGAIVNIDDYRHIERLRSLKLVPDVVSFRYLPDENSFQEDRENGLFIGGGADCKFGVTDEHIKECFLEMKGHGVKCFGLHTMLASNERNPAVFHEVAEMMFKLSVELKEYTGVSVDFINLGGGFGIPHKPEDAELDIDEVKQRLDCLYHEYFREQPLKPKIYMENGRYLTGPAGCLLTKVRHVVKKHKWFIGVDASMSDLMRPALYGAYHHISTFDETKPLSSFDVTGSLCENNDKFAIDRELPTPERGDYLIIHDTGAHGHAMGFNYNGKARSPEVLVNEENGVEGRVRLIRRRETIEDLFSTLEF